MLEDRIKNLERNDIQLGTKLRSNQLHERGIRASWAGDDTSEKCW